MSRGKRVGQASGTECVNDTLSDLADLANRVDLHEHTPVIVNVDQRRSLITVDLETVTNNTLVIVTAALFGRSLAQTFDDNVGISNQFHNNIKLRAMSGQVFVELTNLICGAGVAIEKESAFGVLLRKTGTDQLVGERIRNVVSRVHERLSLLSQFGFILHVAAKNITGRDSGDRVDIGKTNRLGSFTGAGWANQK